MRWQSTLSLLFLSCAADPTQIMVVVQSDLPAEALDEVRIDVDGFGEQPTATADLDVAPLPRTLGLVHRGGPLGPITVEARGMLGDADVVTRSARVSFVRNEARMLVLTLLDSCAGVVCAEGMTCTESGCTSPDVANLPPWTGTLPGADGGAPDGGVDASTDAPIDVPTDVPADSPPDTPTDVRPDTPVDDPRWVGTLGSDTCADGRSIIDVGRAIPAGATVVVTIAWRNDTADDAFVSDSESNEWFEALQVRPGDDPRLTAYASTLTTALSAGSSIRVDHPFSRTSLVVADELADVSIAPRLSRELERGGFAEILTDELLVESGLAFAAVVNRTEATVAGDVGWMPGTSVLAECGMRRLRLSTFHQGVDAGPLVFEAMLSDDADWTAGLVSLPSR